MIRMPIMAVINWRALSLKRLAYLDALKRTGRWQRVFSSQAAFEEALNAANADAETWKRIAHSDANKFVEAAE
jgi:hypothetical protein